MTDSPVPPDLDPVRGHSDDPLSADRRVLVIGAVSMVVLMLVGAVTAAFFTRSACGRIGPDPVLPRAAGEDVDRVLAEALPDLFDDERLALTEYLRGPLADRLGPLAGALDVSGAEGLSPAGGPGSGLVAATGATTTVFGVPAADVRATADVGDGTVVGDGATLYSLALTNPGTGQTDAVMPLDVRLEGGDCFDTATVATPFAFLLAAGEGQLLLFRVEEDGDVPTVELRDAQQGQVWIADLDTPAIPPGVSGARLDGAMGLDLVVVGRRATLDDTAPILSAFTRDGGQLRWSVELDAVAEVAPDGDTPVWAEVVAVGGDTVLVSLSRDDDRGRSTLVAMDAADGAMRWATDVHGSVPVAAHVDADAVTVLLDRGDHIDVVIREADDGSDRGSAGQPDPDGSGFDGRGAVVPGGEEVLATVGRGLVVAGADELTLLAHDVEPALLVDAVVVDGATVLLVASGDGAAAVVFAAP
ncbi:hypothetical protein [Egicoccus sp. AB-alg6-2]|uniref:hypothetical protein n=1 Tax=Egicoccus sp. AB-alg6-2 TaxID=3242692 RepID=UPI00359E6E06